MYPNAEVAFQAGKFRNDKDRKIFRDKYPNPGKAKKIGNSIALRSDWESFKDEWMYYVLTAKFNTPDPKKVDEATYFAKNRLYLKQALLNTKDYYLEEGNFWHDNYWGNCYCEKCRDIKGQNKLGELLMKVRSELTLNV